MANLVGLFKGDGLGLGVHGVFRGYAFMVDLIYQILVSDHAAGATITAFGVLPYTANPLLCCVMTSFYAPPLLPASVLPDEESDGLGLGASPPIIIQAAAALRSARTAAIHIVHRNPETKAIATAVVSICRFSSLISFGNTMPANRLRCS